jgi:HlyD family secretion protein
MIKKLIIVAVVIALVAGLVWYKHFHQETLAVKAVTVDRGPVEASVSNTKAGTIKACHRSKLSMLGGGVVDRLLVKKGDQVQAGQVLLELWNRDSKANLLTAKAESQRACLQASQAKREHERLQTLLVKKLVSVDAVDKSSTAALVDSQECEAANARIEQQQALLDRTQLRAPFAGVIAEINGEVGEYVTPSPPGVLTPPAVDLIDDSCLYVTAPIDEVDAGQLRLGMKVDVTLDAFRNRHFEGTVTRIAPYVVEVEKQARTVDIDVQLVQPPEDIKLLIGYSADTTVILDKKENVLRLPTEALLTGNFAWVINADNKLDKRQIKTGIGNWSYTEILSGVKEGDAVVRAPDQVGLAQDRVVTLQKDHD